MTLATFRKLTRYFPDQFLLIVRHGTLNHEITEITADNHTTGPALVLIILDPATENQ